jgi:hypothetical protein
MSVKRLSLLLLCVALAGCADPRDIAVVPPNWAFPSHHHGVPSDLSGIDQRQPEHL